MPIWGPNPTPIDTFLCGISTPSLPAQGEQRRSAFFNINRDNSRQFGMTSFVYSKR